MDTQDKGKLSYIVKYSIPNRYELSPYGTICKIMDGNSFSEETYVQTSKDPKVASWQRLGTVMEKAFEPFAINQSFIDECLTLALEPEKDKRISLRKLSNLFATRSSTI